MLDKKSDKEVKYVVEALSNLKKNKRHDRPFHKDECLRMGLKVDSLENDNTLQDLVLSIHHCLMHSTSNTKMIKIIENHEGKTYTKYIL